jgi:hypothetical protein
VYSCWADHVGEATAVIALKRVAAMSGWNNIF